MLTFPRSRVLQFYKDNPTWREKGLRLGQAFYRYMDLEKVKNQDDKVFVETLYQAQSDVACKLIIQHTDWAN